MIGLEGKSVPSVIAEKIVQFAEANDKSNLLDEINIYGVSEVDGSSVMSFEWLGTTDAGEFAAKMLEFLEDIKKIVIETGKEAVEQVQPHVLNFTDKKHKEPVLRALYRFRVWPENGKYDFYEKKLVSK